MTKFKELTKKEKVEHIWEYYKLHIIGGGLAIFMLSALLIQIFGPQPPEAAVNLVVMGLYDHDDEKLNNFEREIENIIDNGETGKVAVDTFLVDWNSASPMEVAMNQKLVLMFQAQEIDVMIVEEEKYNSYITNIEDNIYEALDDKPELAQIIQNNEEALVKRKVEGDTREHVYGFYAKDNTKLQGIGLNDKYVVAIPVIAKNKENAIKTLEWLYK